MFVKRRFYARGAGTRSSGSRKCSNLSRPTRPRYVLLFFFITLKPRVEWYKKSMSLKYEPASAIPGLCAGSDSGISVARFAWYLKDTTGKSAPFFWKSNASQVCTRSRWPLSSSSQFENNYFTKMYSGSEAGWRHGSLNSLFHVALHLPS